MIDSDQLEAFRVFAEHLNFTRAARVLHLSQPALHTKIQRLSDALGVALYVREGRTLRLTSHGVATLAHARAAFEQDARFAERLQGGGQARTLVLAAGEGALLYLLGPAIQAWAAPIRVLTRDGPGAVDAVASGLAHLGVCAGDSVTGVVATPLVDVGAVVMMPADHALAQRRTVEPADLEGARLVVPPPHSRHRDALERVLRNASVRWEPAVEAHGWPVMVHLAHLGLGLAVVNACCTAPPGMVARPFPALAAVRYWTVRAAGAAEDVVAFERVILEKGRGGR